jgi:hypothetical protein
VVAIERQKAMNQVDANLTCGFGSTRSFHGNPTPLQDMTAARRFSGPTLEELARAKILGVRAGAEHRYTGVWVVVVEGRAFVRSWNDKPTGWYRAFQAEPLGSIQLAGPGNPGPGPAHSGRATPRRRHWGLRGEVRHQGVREVGARFRGAAPRRQDVGAPAGCRVR